MSEELDQYIKSCFDDGYSDEEIYDRLVGAGWDAAQVKEAMQKMKSSSPKKAEKKEEPKVEEEKVEEAVESDAQRFHKAVKEGMKKEEQKPTGKPFNFVNLIPILIVILVIIFVFLALKAIKKGDLMDLSFLPFYDQLVILLFA